MSFPPAESYRGRWTGWVKDPRLATHGLTFDRTPAGPIVAPQGMVRVCAWHADFDERPTCYLDLASEAEAQWVCVNVEVACGWNVDFATGHDDAGRLIIPGPI